MADGVMVGGWASCEYVSCQPVITLFVPLIDTLCGRSLGPVYYDKNTISVLCEGYFEVRSGWTC